MAIINIVVQNRPSYCELIETRGNDFANIYWFFFYKDSFELHKNVNGNTGDT